jgi:hypothetical protein
MSRGRQKGMKLTDEQKAKMREGRRLAFLNRQSNPLSMNTIKVEEANDILMGESSSKRALGSKAYYKYIRGGKLGLREMQMAKCYDCMGAYQDGRVSCGVSSCPNYQDMPYKHVIDPNWKNQDKALAQSDWVNKTGRYEQHA